MALLKENINNFVTDDLNKRNQNWTTIDDSLELKADKTYVDSKDALKADKTYVDNKVKTDVPTGAKFTDTVYTHPATHSADMITDGTTNKAYTSAEKTKLSGIATSANNYSHPTSDGSKHVPANGTTNNGKVLKAGSTAGTYIWSNDNDTITTINGKTGVIAKADIVALGIPAQDTVVDISGKADKTYVDDKVKTDVPVGAKFTDTVYAHPASHPASMITGLPTSLPASGGNADTVGGFTVGVNVPANAKFTDTNTTYTEITTAEIDAGTASTGRTITGRRLKYLLDKIVALFPTKTSELTNDSGFLTSVTKSSVGLSSVTNDKQMPISGGVLENYREKLTTVSATNGLIDLSLGNVFQHTPSANMSYSINNAVNGQAHSFTLIVNMGSTVRTLYFPASVKWQGGEIPNMTTASKTYILTFMTVDGGTNWLGIFGGEF